ITKMIKIKKRWLFIAVIILVVVGYFIFNSFFKKNTNGYITEKIDRGVVSQSISETGSVRATDNIELGFKNSGRIKAINAIVGQDVKAGDVLVRLNTDQLAIQLRESNAALEVANKQYDKLLNGDTPEDIKTVEDSKIAAEDDLNSAYSTAINILNDAYTKIYNAYTTVTLIRDSYFSSADQQGIKVIDSKDVIQNKLTDTNLYLNTAKNSSKREDIDFAVSRTISNLNSVYEALRIVRETCDEGKYYYDVSATSKTSLDTQKTNINTALASVTGSQQDISSYKIALQKAENDLTLKLAKPRQEDVGLYQAQIRQAEANVSLLQSQIEDMYLKSPIDGKITKINNKTGEVISINESIINLLSSNPFQIKTDIYEQDIVNVEIDNPVEVSLIAFPKEIFSGKVISIDPAEKIIDNVVYYEVTIDFDGNKDKIKSGMTADIIIKTNEKNDVLRVSKNAVENINGKAIVQIKKADKIENREIETGLEGDDYLEVVSGLQKGEDVVIGKK
ncbi:MAG: efflux RND transporter periplasmic adaptor subunit, partial [bacterium]|nr:efflux RND transporter periplasmic adaptor subunit [bacterium]